MPRYHISEKTDRVNICRAQTVESCPLKSEGGEGSAAHFDNKQDAFAYRESTLADKAKKEGNSFGTLSKNSKNEGTVSTANSDSGKYSKLSDENLVDEVSELNHKNNVLGAQGNSLLVKSNEVNQNIEKLKNAISNARSKAEDNGTINSDQFQDSISAAAVHLDILQSQKTEIDQNVNKIRNAVAKNSEQAEAVAREIEKRSRVAESPASNKEQQSDVAVNSEAQKKRGRKASPERLAFRDKMDANVDRFRGKFENNDVYKDLPNVKILLNEEFDNYDDKKKLHILKFALSDVSSKNAELSKNTVTQDISRDFRRDAYSGGMGASGTIAKQQQSLDQLEGHLKGLAWAAYDPEKVKAIKERKSQLVEKERNKAKSQSQYSTVNDSKSAHAAISGLSSDGFNSGMNNLVKNTKLQGSASGMFSVGKTYASVVEKGNEYKFIEENYNKDKKEYRVVFSANGNKFQSVRNSAGNWSVPKEYASPSYSY